MAPMYDGIASGITASHRQRVRKGRSVRMTSQARGRARSIAQIVASVASDRVRAAKPTSEPIVTAPSSPAFKAAAARYSSGGRTSRPTTASSTKVPICASQPEAGASDDEGVRVRGPACVISPVRIQRSEQLERRLFQVSEPLGRDGGALDGLERGHLARVHAGDQGDLIILRDKNALDYEIPLIAGVDSGEV